MANRAGHDDLALAAQADSNGWMYAGLVDLDHVIPDFLHIGMQHADFLRINFLFGINRDDRVQIARDGTQVKNLLA